MNARRTRVRLLVSICLPAALAAAAVSAQTVETVQTLDRIAVFSKGEVGEMAFDKPDSSAPYAGYNVTGSDFRACKLTATDGLYCLDGKSVIRWRNPVSGGPGSELFSCNDVPGLDTRSTDTCTSMTVDLSGAIWLAGKNKGKTHNLVKVIEGNQGGGWAEIGDSGYWAKTVATGRPLLLDITSIDGEVGTAFTYRKGILGLEQRKTVMFFPESGGAPVEIATGKTGWGLAGNEQMQSVTLLGNQVLVTTNNGRILSKDAAGSDPASPVVSAIPSAATVCNSLDPMYGIRSSAKSGLVYVTNRNHCETLAYDPGDWSVLKTLSTGTNAPEGPTVAPGIGIDLADCSGECTLIEGAKLSAVSLSSLDASGLTLFQVKNIPDCRWLATITSYVDLPEACKLPGVVQDLNGAPIDLGDDIDLLPGNTAEAAAQQYLNVTPMLPSEITTLFDGSGVPPSGLPDLLISPQYRGQDCSGGRCIGGSESRFIFEAFFGVLEPGVIFNGVFEGEFDVLTLAGRELGCEDTANSNDLATLLKWDVVTKVSETYLSIDGRHVDTLTNTGCGSSRTSNFGWSMLSYNLEVTPDTYYGTGQVIEANDAVFARLLQKLYVDLGHVLDNYACQTADADPGLYAAPISSGDCSTLRAGYANGLDKLGKCIAATYQPKTSAGNQNCQSFQTQFASFRNTLAGVVGTTYDPANRRGELDVRARVIQHVYDTRFAPSVPNRGFCREQNVSTGGVDGCDVP